MPNNTGKKEISGSGNWATTSANFHTLLKGTYASNATFWARRQYKEGDGSPCTHFRRASAPLPSLPLGYPPKHPRKPLPLPAHESQFPNFVFLFTRTMNFDTCSSFIVMIWVRGFHLGLQGLLLNRMAGGACLKYRERVTDWLPSGSSISYCLISSMISATTV